jgi:hypothetical protein
VAKSENFILIGEEKQLTLRDWFFSYRKANPLNNLRTTYFLAKMSYDECQKTGDVIFTPYIPKIPKEIKNETFQISKDDAFPMVSWSSE